MKFIIALLLASSVSAIHLKQLGEQKMTADESGAAITDENLLMLESAEDMADAEDDELEEEIADNAVKSPTLSHSGGW